MKSFGKIVAQFPFLSSLSISLFLAACSASSVSGSGAPVAAIPVAVRRACGPVNGDHARCLALVRDGLPNGFTPQQLEAAYALPVTSRGSGQTVAIVNAYDDPNAASDLAAYRSYFGLPAATFTKYNQSGQTSKYPVSNTGWAVEVSIDLDMVSASCPNCAIILVEANSDNPSDLGAAEAEAVTLGAHVVSNSFTGDDLPEKDFSHPGVAYVATAADEGYGKVSEPAAFDDVVSVGGTSLYVDSKSKRGFSEVVWAGTSSGCATTKKPRWQHDPGCSQRTANDIAAVADPSTPVDFYDTFGEGGWASAGGTSISAPLIAGVFGLAGNASSQRGGRTFWLHHSRRELFPILSGSNGTCSPSYLCTAGTGEFGTYSGPAGWGVPNGVGAF
jgi:subtilase family serine protease